MNQTEPLWADARLVYAVATAAVTLLLATFWLFKRRRKEGRQAGVVCLLLSIALHGFLLWFVPLLPSRTGGSSTQDRDTGQDAGITAVEFSTFDPAMTTADASGDTAEAQFAPLPVSSLTDLVQSDLSTPAESDVDNEPAATSMDETAQETPPPVPESLAGLAEQESSATVDDFEDQLQEIFDAVSVVDGNSSASPPDATPSAEVDAAASAPTETRAMAASAPTATAPKSLVPGDLENDFANRIGAAKEVALLRTGGDAETEAAVEAALRFLADSQSPDGSWDPRASGAGQERAPLGMNRGGAGARATTGITGLALLTLMGAGNTHHQGDYAENVYRGLAYLIRTQKPSGSLAGNASVYAATYSHGMAALAMCEAAALTKDQSAVTSARRAINHTTRTQHPTTGGWRYTEGDPGDLSQLGWQAMVLDAGYRAGVEIEPRSVAGVQRFLRSVRMGNRGGLASYRPGEAPSRTMTAEALATRLLIGQQVPPEEIAEAERYLLQQPPGVGRDNYYYWYYATLALHQLQDDAWDQWNEALKRRLLATQQSSGGWAADSLWGGYGGTVYTTSMAALCLETYYRHAVRSDNDRIANRPDPVSPSTIPR